MPPATGLRKPKSPKVPGRVPGRVPGESALPGGLLGAVLGGCLQWKNGKTALLPAALSPALLVGESLRGNRIGATGLRASERKSASERVSERVSEREGFQRFLRGLEF